MHVCMCALDITCRYSILDPESWLMSGVTGYIACHKNGDVLLSFALSCILTCVQAPLSLSTHINQATGNCAASQSDDQDAKSVRIQQLRETLIGVTSEKACLAETLNACQARIVQLEAQTSRSLLQPYQARCQFTKFACSASAASDMLVLNGNIFIVGGCRMTSVLLHASKRGKSLRTASPHGVKRLLI